MKVSKESQLTQRILKSFQGQPGTFVFFDRGTGARRFEVKARADGSLPVDEALSSLVLQCVLGGQEPEDLSLAITAGEDVLREIRRRAKKVIAACRFMGSVSVTQRQQEVIRGMLRTFPTNNWRSR